MSNIELEVKQIIADQLNKQVEDIKLSDDVITNLSADSLDTVEIVMALEDHFKVTIPDEEAGELRIVELIVNKIKELRV